MQRRKFVIGLGSLAAGGAAATGTGALSTQSAQRQLNGRVASDASGYTQLTSGGRNGQFADTKENGEIYLNFDQNGSGGEGLSPDSVSMFEDVFKIENWSLEGPKRYYIERNGPNMGRVEFFSNLGGASDKLDPASYFSITDTPDKSTGPVNILRSKAIDAEDPEYNKGAISVAVKIDLRGAGLSNGDSISDIFGEDDNFSIVAAQPTSE